MEIVRKRFLAIENRIEESNNLVENNIKELNALLNSPDAIDMALAIEEYKKANDLYEEALKMIENKNYLGVEIGIPEKLKDLFIDSLKAFESYSKLSGYEVKFSYDNSLKDKLGFKFTVTENPNNISNDEIRADIKEFMDKIQKGEKFDDLPVVINLFEHQMVLTTLKNRINFIEHSFNLEKNMRELYERAMRDLLATKNLFSQQPMTVNNNYLQSGGENSSRQIEANNANVITGDGNFIEDNSINIQHSFNEKKTIIEKIDNSIRLIDNEESLSLKDKQELKRHLGNIKEEIEEEAKPDASKLKKAWDKIKGIGERVVFSHELSQALEWIGGQFNFVRDFLKNIPS